MKNVGKDIKNALGMKSVYRNEVYKSMFDKRPVSVDIIHKGYALRKAINTVPYIQIKVVNFLFPSI